MSLHLLPAILHRALPRSVEPALLLLSRKNSLCYHLQLFPFSHKRSLLLHTVLPLGFPPSVTWDLSPWAQFLLILNSYVTLLVRVHLVPFVLWWMSACFPPQVVVPGAGLPLVSG
jgi:hypothetical protein